MSIPIPSRPNLEFDRKQAKRLLKALRSAEPEAQARFLAHHPRGVPPEPKLADALLVIAREYGFASWPRWCHFAETRNLTREQQAAIALQALCSNNVRDGRTLLEAEPDLARSDFFLACAGGEVETVRHQLERESGLASRTGGLHHWQPLEYVCFSRLWRSDPERAPRLLKVAELLLTHGADANAFHLDNPAEPLHRQTVLFGAAGIANHPGLTRLLLQAGADPDEGLPEPDPQDPSKSPWGPEALYHACEFRDTACLQLLLEARPHPIRVSYCLARALDFENPEAVRLLLQHGADANFSPHYAYLHKAVQCGRSAEVVQLLAEAGADVRKRDHSGLTAYQWAVRLGHEGATAVLQSHGAPPATEEDRQLAEIFRGGSVESHAIPPLLLCEAARRNDTAAVRALLKAGAAVDATAYATGPFTPLHLAAWRGNFETVEALIEAGADLHWRNPHGGDALGTTLHGSTYCTDPEGGTTMHLPEEVPPRGYIQIVELLLARGAALPRAVSGNAAVREVLLRHGCSPEA
ncbi:MAG: ankyrin repeat domain-containing protein [Verrucomicrobiota bacterium JB022]|nr:ankyrin repeat domain-containing protein [Verrucomicrobiota bacterium JB022]